MWRWNGKGLYPLTMTCMERERERRIETGGNECAESKYNMDEVRGEREEDMKLKVTSGVLYGNEKGFVGRAEKRKMLKERMV